MIGFLKTRGPVCEENGIDKTKAINLAIFDTKLVVESFEQNRYSGIVPEWDYYKKKYCESFSYYFTCSSDFKEVEYVHIYDYGSGCEETILDITEEFKLLIIGKCLLYKYANIK